MADIEDSKDKIRKALQKAPKSGRPAIICDEIVVEICQYIMRGHPFDPACVLAGVPARTGRTWLNLGMQSHTGRAQLNHEYENFYHSVKYALAMAELTDAEVVRAAAKKGDWKAAAWRLERLFPKHYGKTAMVQADVRHQGHDGGPLKIEMMTPAQREERIRELEAKRRAMLSAVPDNVVPMEFGDDDL